MAGFSTSSATGSTAGFLARIIDKDEPTALIYYMAYTRNDVKDTSQRPVSFLYNGGPGSASVWLHHGIHR